MVGWETLAPFEAASAGTDTKPLVRGVVDVETVEAEESVDHHDKVGRRVLGTYALNPPSPRIY